MIRRARSQVGSQLRKGMDPVRMSEYGAGMVLSVVLYPENAFLRDLQRETANWEGVLSRTLAAQESSHLYRAPARSWR